jgi:hypothetical protein
MVTLISEWLSDESTFVFISRNLFTVLLYIVSTESFVNIAHCVVSHHMAKKLLYFYSSNCICFIIITVDSDTPAKWIGILPLFPSIEYMFTN